MLNLDDIFSGKATPTGAVERNLVNDVDLLSDIFAGTASTVSPTANSAGVSTDVSTDTTTAKQLAAPKQMSENACFKAFEKDGLTVTMDLVKIYADPAFLEITCNFLNSTHKDFDRFVFQAAVPKYVSMEWQPASANTIPANNLGKITQTIKVRTEKPHWTEYSLVGKECYSIKAFNDAAQDPIYSKFPSNLLSP